jgi:oligopeptide transport system substrate-binding protein
MSPSRKRVDCNRTSLRQRAVALAIVIFSLCASAASVAQPGTVLRLGNPGEPQTLDPHRYNLRLEETLLTDLFIGLTTFAADGSTIPGVASSWQVSDDGLRWTFNLRPDLTWSDGQPLTADDFVFAYQRLQAPATAASLAYFMYPLKNAAAVNAGKMPVEALGVSAPDSRTLILELEQPYPHLLERLLYPTAYPLPKHAIETHGDSWVKAENWVSNGAYRLQEWRPQSYVHLVANAHFNPAPAITEVFYYPLANEQTAYNRYRAGEVDAIATFPSGELDYARRELTADLRTSVQLSIMYLVFNSRVEPFSDARVREALAMMMQPEVLTDKVQRSGNVASRSFVPAMVSDYQSVPGPQYQLDLAERLSRGKALLAEAGFSPDRPLEITLRYISGAEAKRTALTIAAFWKPLGVKTQLHQAELKVHFADLRQGDFQVAQAGWIGENNAEHYLSLLVSDTGDVNYGGFADDQFDAMMASARQEADLDERNRLLRVADERAVGLYPVVPMYSLGVRRLVNPKLRGWNNTPRDVHPVRFLSLEP